LRTYIEEHVLLLEKLEDGNPGSEKLPRSCYHQ
jgi:hypothetical protein